MYKKRKILNILNLAFFLASFVLFTVNIYRVSQLITSVDAHHVRFVSDDSPDLSATRQQISEKNESEFENIFSLKQVEMGPAFSQSFIFPAKVMLCQISAPPLDGGPAPVYLLVRNFRI
jgi:hypothetical protein